MCAEFRFCRLFVFVCLLACASTVLAQQPAGPDSHEAFNEADAHQHAAMEDAHVSRASESYAMWVVRSMGTIGVLTLGAGALCFVVTLLVVIRGRGPFACAALVLLVPIPFLIGLYGMGSSLIASFQVVSYAEVSPKASEIFAGLTESLVNPMLGLVVMVPSYLVATLGSIIRSFAKPSDRSDDLG